MANWTTLKAAIAKVIKTNGNQEITGQTLQNTLNSIVNAIGENATFAGIATPTTNPGTPDGPVFYFAITAGAYNNFGGITLSNNGLYILRWNSTSWAAISIMNIVQTFGNSATNVISQKAVTDNIMALQGLLALKSSFIDGYCWADTAKDNHITGGNTYNTLSRLAPIPVREGEKWLISTSGIGIGHRYFIVNSSYNIVIDSEDTAYSTNIINIPEGASWLLVNCSSSDKEKFRIFNLSIYNTYLDDLTKFKSYRLPIENVGFSGGTKLEKTGDGVFKYGQGIDESPAYVGGRYTYTRYTAVSDNVNIGIINPWESSEIEYRNIAIFDNYGNLVYQVNVGLRYFYVVLIKGYTIEASAEEVYINVIPQKSIQDDVKSIQDDVKSIQGDVKYQLVKGKYWTKNKETDIVVGHNTYDGLSRLEPISVAKGDVFFVKSKGIGIGLSYYIVDKDYNCLAEDGKNVVINKEVTIDQDNAAFLLINNDDNNELAVVKLINGYIGSSLYFITKEIEAQLEEKIAAKAIRYINCIGDSVTEGMGTNGAHSSDYGKDPYPAQLYTLLADNGYNNVQVVNCGHGGERLQDIAVRSGGIGCYINDDIIIPSDNSAVALGEKVVSEDNKITGTKLSLYFKDQDGEDYNVYLTQTSHDTNPCVIDGVEYTMTIDGTHNYIRKRVSDGKETTIPKGTLFFTANNINADVNIFYIGINGSSSLTLEKWTAVNKICGLANGGKYIVLGCTHSLWNNWPDVVGENNDEKYEYYRRKCFEEFGVHFIDLYDDFFRHAMDYCLEKGYFSDKSEEEITSMRETLNSHVVPKEFSYNGTSTGNVHLSKEGYYVIGRLLFDRLQRLNYI